MWWMLTLACDDGEATAPEAPEGTPEAVVAETTPRPQSGAPGKARNGPNNPPGKGSKGGKRGSPGPPPGGGMQGGPPGGVQNGASGGAFQDPSGFPPFHDWPAPKGPAVSDMGDWSAPVLLTSKPSGGYRPQIAVSPKSDELHAVYYDRVDAGDLIRHRRSSDGLSWTEPVQLGHTKDRNWGPDIVARDDGSVVIVYDHALPDFTSVGYTTRWDGSSWSTPQPLTPDNGGEIGSGHVANTTGDDLAYIFIGKQVGEQHRFAAQGRWYTNGSWGAITALSDGTEDAWHTNVERRPDGSVLAGFDIGTGGSETTLYLAEGRDGAFGPLENLSASGSPGERPHFAFSPDGTDHVTWFHKVSGSPQHIYVRSGKPGSWGGLQEPSAGFGGFHFDPDIAVNADGVLCLVWGWDSGDDAEMVYALNAGDGWSRPKKIADIDWGKPGLASLDVDSSGRFHVIWNQGVRGENAVYYAALDPR